MATYQHLSLQRLVGDMDRRKRGFGQASGREPKAHGAKIQTEVLEVIDRHKARPKIAEIDPAFILKVVTTGIVTEDDWAKLGLTVLAIEPDRTIILFANDAELGAFKERVAAYNGEKPEGQKNQPYAGLIEAIESVSDLTAEDRIGRVLRSEGYATPLSFTDERQILDVELWPVADFNADLFIHRVTASLEQNDGTVVSTYRGSSALLMRVECAGDAIRALLELTEISTIDRPPTPDWPELAASDLTIGNVPNPVAAPVDSITIGIIDSGLTSAHPFLVGFRSCCFWRAGHTWR